MNKSEFKQKCLAQLNLRHSTVEVENLAVLQIFFEKNLTYFVRDCNPLYMEADFSRENVGSAFVNFVENVKDESNAYFCIKYNFGGWLLEILPESIKEIYGTASMQLPS